MLKNNKILYNDFTFQECGLKKIGCVNITREIVYLFTAEKIFQKIEFEI
jgi:hypothetical protein